MSLFSGCFARRLLCPGENCSFPNTTSEYSRSESRYDFCFAKKEPTEKIREGRKVRRTLCVCGNDSVMEMEWDGKSEEIESAFESTAFSWEFEMGVKWKLCVTGKPIWPAT